MRYVVDCSVAIRWFVAHSDWERAVLALHRFSHGEIDLLAPDVIIPEFGHVMRKLVIGKKVRSEFGEAALDRFLALPVAMTPARDLARSALELASVLRDVLRRALRRPGRT